MARKKVEGKRKRIWEKWPGLTMEKLREMPDEQYKEFMRDKREIYQEWLKETKKKQRRKR